jgi:hypothetical protein
MAKGGLPPNMQFLYFKVFFLFKEMNQIITNLSNYCHSKKKKSNYCHNDFNIKTHLKITLQIKVSKLKSKLNYNFGLLN